MLSLEDERHSRSATVSHSWLEVAASATVEVVSGEEALAEVAPEVEVLGEAALGAVAPEVEVSGVEVLEEAV